MPEVKFLRNAYPTLCPREPPKVAAAPTYVVQNGETLSEIARTQLGSASRWPEIYRLNRETLRDQFDILDPGTRLKLPENVGGTAVAEENTLWK